MKKHKMKVLAFLLALTMLFTLGLAGCDREDVTENSESETQGDQTPSGDETEEVVIRYGLWGSEEEINTWKAIALTSEESYPGVKIEIQTFPSSEDFWDNLPAQIAAKTAPDIVKLTNEGAFEYIEKGLFLPLNDLVDQADVDLSGYTDSAKDIWTVDNELYGVPISVAPSMFFINKTMWEDAELGDYPETWEDVKVAAEILTTGDVTGLIINIHPYHLTNYALSYGGGWNNGETINSEGNIKALETVVEFFDNGWAVTPASQGFGWDGEVFANEKGAMSTGGYWYKGFLANSAPNLEYVVVPIPQGTTRASTSHSDALVVLKDAKSPIAAVQAIYHLTGDEALIELMENVGVNPAKPELSSQYFEVNPEFAAVEEMIPLSKDFGYPARTMEFNDEIIRLMEEKILTNSDRSIKDILDELQEEFS